MNWISVEDELPPCDGEYITYLENGLKHEKRIYMYTYFQNSWLSINGSVFPDMPKPTHWMPLPEPPANKQ